MRMVAMKPLRYGGRSLVAGDEFDVVRDKDVKILTAIKKAKVTGTIVEAMTPVVSEPPEVDARLSEDDPAIDGVTPRRRYYRRRDLKAEGSD